MTRNALAAALALAALPVRPSAEGPEPIDLARGESASLCARLPCPVIAVQCDDPSVVKVEGSEKGPTLKGLKAGATLCGVTTSGYQRKVFRVTVKEGGSPPPAPG